MEKSIGKKTLKRYFFENAENLKSFQYRRGYGLPEDYQD
jgi:predicted transcriptional regulator